MFASTYKVHSAAEILAAMNVAVPGDTLVMANGTWTDQTIIFDGNGTENNNIVLIAEEPGKVILTGKSKLRIAGSYLTVSGLYFLNGYSTNDSAVIEFRNGSGKLAQHCRLTNTSIENYNPSDKSVDYKWISLYGTNNRVDHCHMKGKKHNGTTLVVWLDAVPDYHLIDSNYFDNRPELGVNGGETIRIGTSQWWNYDSYTTVEYNLFKQCNGEAEIISNKSGHNTFRYNTFYESEGSLTLRHGDWAEVHGNFFIGNNKSNTGGIRIIGENHKVYNNYMENLRGTGYRAALTMMNGVENYEQDSTRYGQVVNAIVVNNTIINSLENFNIGSGSDDELVLPPKDCTIANNLVKCTTRIIEYEDTPSDFFYEGNIFYGGPLGIEQPDGIQIIDPQLRYDADSLWRLSESSPAINASAGLYDFVLTDFDGQIRSDGNDVGADEFSSDSIKIRPLKSRDVGPDWYPPPPTPVKVFSVEAGQDSLIKALTEYNPGDIIELVTDGGIYTNSSNLELNIPVVIRAKADLTEKPVIRQNNSSSSTRIIFEIRNGGSLSLTGVELDGMSGTNTPAKYLIRTDDDPFDKHYKLFIDSCLFKDVSVENFGNFFRTYRGTFADSIIITNSTFTNCGSEGLRFDAEDLNSGIYSVGYLEISNCTFWNIPGEALVLYGGDNVIFTPGPVVKIDQCTFDNIGFGNYEIINAHDCDQTIIKNSVFSNSPNSVSLYGQLSQISYCDIFNAGPVKYFNGAKAGNGLVDYDPLYEEAETGNFTLSASSPLLRLSENGNALGDLRWAVYEPDYFVLEIVTFGEGTVSANPQSIESFYKPGEIVTLTAHPAEGYMLSMWSGDAQGTEESVIVTMDDDKEVIAAFTSIVSADNNKEMPDEFALLPNYPNPFNPSTLINYQVPHQSFVSIQLYDITGRLVKNLINNYHQPGYYCLNIRLEQCSTGVYIVRMTAGDRIFTNKIMLAK